MIEKQAITKLR